MDLVFTDEAIVDLEYIHRFLIEAEVANHQHIVEDIISGADSLLVFPRLGVQVQQADTNDTVRDYYYKNFVLRYLIRTSRISILRVWHQRENERNE